MSAFDVPCCAIFMGDPGAAGLGYGARFDERPADGSEQKPSLGVAPRARGGDALEYRRRRCEGEA